MTPVEKDANHMVVSFVCDFNHGDDNRTDCHVIYEASHFTCAEMHLHLQVMDQWRPYRWCKWCGAPGPMTLGGPPARTR